MKQRFQQIEGLVRFDDFNATCANRCWRATACFALTDGEGRLREFDGHIDGREFTGTVTQGDGARAVQRRPHRHGGAAIAGSEPLPVPKGE